jgi:vacuolar-type H+-ATPase catalytic subunit A/Vma1
MTYTLDRMPLNYLISILNTKKKEYRKYEDIIKHILRRDDNLIRVIELLDDETFKQTIRILLDIIEMAPITYKDAIEKIFSRKDLIKNRNTTRDIFRLHSII